MPTTTKSPAVFFDRDGVLIATTVKNGKPYAIKHVSEMQILPGVAQLIAHYRAEGYKIVVVTNQPDVGNGLNTQAAVEEMHSLLKSQLPIDAIKACYHSQQAGCSCRKPGIGMLLEAAQELDIDLNKSIMVGDRSSDIEAGENAGCFTIFVNYGYNEPLKVTPNLIVSSITELLNVTDDKRESQLHDHHQTP